MRKKTSLKDIAMEVGVSTALVSYVLNGKMLNRIGTEVADRIRTTAAKLNYSPNQVARSLKTNRTRTIGLIVADISNPFSSALARIIEDEADKFGYTVIFGSSDENETRFSRLVETLLNRQVDGLIIFPPAGSEKQVKRIKAQGVPFVLVDRFFPTINCSSVCIDNFQASVDATTHLLQNGRKRIGLISYKSPLMHLQQRAEGYRAALATAKIKRLQAWEQLIDITNEPRQVHNALESLLHLKAPVDAVLFASNRIATIALKYIHQHHIAIPAQLEVAAFDQSETFDLFHTPVPYIEQPLTDIGQQATQILLQAIAGSRKIAKLKLHAPFITGYKGV